MEIGSNIYNGLADTSFLLPITAVGGNVIIRDGFADYNGFSNITSIGGDLEINLYDAFEDSNTFEGLSGITNVPGNLKINHFGVTSFEGLSNIATVGGNIDIYVPHVTSFNLPLTSVGGYVSINSFEMNDISGLTNLTTIPGELKLLNLLIPDFSPLNNLTSVGGIYLENLKNIHNLDGFSNLTQINGQLYINNCIELSSLQALSDVTSLNGNLTITGNTWLQTLSGLDGLTSLNYHNLNLSNNYLLTDISAISNIEEHSIRQLTIKNNQALAICNYPSICSYSKYRVPDISGNLPECANINCYNTIKGTVRSITIGADCATGVVAKGVKIKCTSSDGHTYITYASGGTYELDVPAGNYTITAVTDLTNYTLQPNQFTDSFTTIGNTVVHDFCLSSAPNENKYKLTMLPLSKPGPGSEVSYSFSFKNIGTNATGSQKKTIVIEFDPQRLFYSGISNDPSTLVINNELGRLEWKCGDILMPFQSNDIVFSFDVLPLPNNMDGDIITVSASVEGLNASVSQKLNTSNEMYFKHNVLEGNQVLIDDADEYLTYMLYVRALPASRLVDVLDEKLDMNTFELLASSSGRIYLTDNRIDFINKPEVLIYRIKPKTTINVDDVIISDPEMLCDCYIPVHLYPVETEFVTVLGNEEVIVDSKKLYVYPNPASTIINFESSETIINVVMYNSLGQEVSQISANGITQADVSNLATGMYICHVKDINGNIETRKIIINK